MAEESSSDSVDIFLESVKEEESVDIICLESSGEHVPGVLNDENDNMDKSESSGSCVIIDDNLADSDLVIGDLQACDTYTKFLREGPIGASSPKKNQGGEVNFPHEESVKTEKCPDMGSGEDSCNVTFVNDSDNSSDNIQISIITSLSIDGECNIKIQEASETDTKSILDEHLIEEGNWGKESNNNNLRKRKKSSVEQPSNLKVLRTQGGIEAYPYIDRNEVNTEEDRPESSGTIIDASQDKINDLEALQKEKSQVGTGSKQDKTDVGIEQVGRDETEVSTVVASQEKAVASQDIPLGDQLALSSDDDQISLAASLELFSEEEEHNIEDNEIRKSSEGIDPAGEINPTSLATAKSLVEKTSLDPRQKTLRKVLALSKLTLVPSRQKVPLTSEEDKVEEEEEEDSGLDVYCLGNYCRRILSGVLCPKDRCGWVHCMTPDHAVQQLRRISAHRPLDALLTFYRFFTNLDIQERLAVEAQDLLEEDEPAVEHKEVCKAVFRAMVRVCGDIVLHTEDYLDLVDTSTSLFTARDGQEVLVPLFSLAIKSLAPDCEEDRLLLIRWSWDRIYLESLELGLVLPQQFFSDICGQLMFQPSSKSQLAELLLYTSLVPSLQPSLTSLSHLLEGSPPPALADTDTALFTARSLSSLSITDWQNISQLGDIKSGLPDLVEAVKHESPVDVYRFYENLPEMSGMVIPQVPQPPPDQLQLSVHHYISKSKWQELASHFSSVPPRQVESLAEFSETFLLQLACLTGQQSLPHIFSVLLTALDRRGSPLHRLFLSQVGLGLLLSLARASLWDQALDLLQLLTHQLATDFLNMKLPLVGQFCLLTQAMVPLSVLEVLLQSQRKEELLQRLQEWNCLEGQQGSEQELERRDLLLTRLMAWLLEAGPDISSVSVLVKLSDILAPRMRGVSDTAVRRGHEELSNKLLVLMLNLNMSGSDLWCRYLVVRSCHHQLTNPVGRGLVSQLAYSRMLDQATKVYQSTVKWGVYSIQNSRTRPLRLLLSTSLSLEEFFVVVREFLARLDINSDSLQVFLYMHETSNSCIVKHLDCIRSTKEEAMLRLKNTLRMLVPPLAITMGSVPYIPHEMVQHYCNSQYLEHTQ